MQLRGTIRGHDGTEQGEGEDKDGCNPGIPPNGQVIVSKISHSSTIFTKSRPNSDISLL